MYSRPTDPRSRDVRVPHNYGGSIFGSSDTPTRVIPVRDGNTQRRQQSTPPPIRRDISPRELPPCEEEPQIEQNRPEKEECMCERCDEKCEERCEERGEEKREEKCDSSHKPEEKKPFSILSPIGALGTEELLLIALALIIFQGGKEPELSLLLLALLFIN